MNKIITLDRFDNIFFDSNGKEINITLPIETSIFDDSVYLYTSDKKAFIDYSPEILGYYWIYDNKCIRTRKGLVYKDSSEEEALMSVFKDGQFFYKTIDWEESKKPFGEEEYDIKSLNGLSAFLEKKKNSYFLIIDDNKYEIIMGEVTFKINNVWSFKNY